MIETSLKQQQQQKQTSVLLGPAARTKELKKKITKDGFFMMGHLGAHII